MAVRGSTLRDLKALAINLLLYKIGWFGAVLLAAAGRPRLAAILLAGLIAIHLRLVPEWRPELRLVVLCGLVGAVADSAQMAAGVLTFDAGSTWGWLCPPWIILMWMQLGTTLRYCLRFLQGRWLLAAAMGAVAGPFSFYAGQEMGAAVLHPDQVVAIGSLGVVWLLAMPLMMWLAGPAAPVASPQAAAEAGSLAA